jgi:FkbM family methyltransferase
MSIRRLLKSVVRDLLPYAELDFRTPYGLHLYVPDRGAWSSLGEVFLARLYDPFYRHLCGVHGWVDLGCNNGFFSFGLLDYLSRLEEKVPDTRAFLGDANERCIAWVLRSIGENGLQNVWRCQHVVVGPPGATVCFSQDKDSLHSNIFGRGRTQKKSCHNATDLPALLACEQNIYDLIKIDIEGAELFLFKHHGDLLKKFRYGLCEWHAPPYDGPALREAIKGLGGEVVEVQSHSAGGRDLSRGHSWMAPVGMALWRNAAPAV